MEKKSKFQFWPICCTTTFGCVSFVILAIAIGIAIGAIFIFLGQRFFTNRHLSPDETQLVSIPDFLCQSVSLSAGSETTMYLLDQAPPLSVYSPVIHNNFQTNLRYLYFQTFLQANSIVTVRACVPDSTIYNMHIFSGLSNLNSFVNDPTTVTRYSLIPSLIVQSCRVSNLNYNSTNGRFADVYVVAFVNIRSGALSTFAANVTVQFNRSLYSLDFAKNSIKQLSNCTSFSSTSPCQLDVPQGSSSNALVVAAEPPNWDNVTNIPVTLQCNARSSSFVIITIVPIVTLVLAFIAVGICCNLCCPRCHIKDKLGFLNSGNDGRADVKIVVPEGIKPYVPNEDTLQRDMYV